MSVANQGPGKGDTTRVMSRITGSATSVFKLKSMMPEAEYAVVRNLFMGSKYLVLAGAIGWFGVVRYIKYRRNSSADTG